MIMKTNSSSLLQVYFFSIVGTITLLTTLLPHYVMGAICSYDSHWLKQHTLEMRDFNDVAARLAKIRRNNNPEASNIIGINDRDLTLAHIARIEVVRDGQTTVIVDHTNGTLSQVLKDKGLLKIFSERAFKNYTQTITGYNVTEVTNIKIRIMQEGQVLFTIEVMQNGGVLLRLNESAYNSFSSINWHPDNIKWEESTKILFEAAKAARNQESTYRQEKESNTSFENVFTSPEHILLALATRSRSSETSSDFHNTFNNLSNRPTGMQRIGELTLGLVSNRFSAQTRRTQDIEDALYQSIQTVRPEDRRSNGVDKTEYPSNIERAAFFKTEQQTSETSLKERKVSDTTNLNEKGETDYTLTEEVKGRIQELVTAISHKGIIEIFGEPFSGRRTIVNILADLINATHDPNHRYHKEALELIPENLRDISIHRLEESIYSGTKFRGEDTEKFQNLVTDLLSYEGRAILFTSNPNLLLRNTNTDSNQSTSGASNLTGTLKEPIRDQQLTLILTTNRTQQTQITREDMFVGRQTINIPTLTQQEILEYIKPLAENKNSVNGQELFTPTQLTTVINRTIYIAEQHPTLTGVGITGAKNLLNAVFDNTQQTDLPAIKNDIDVRYHVDRIASQVFTNGVMDIGTYIQTQANRSAIKEEIERHFIPPNSQMLDTFISRMIHTTSRIAPHVEVLLGPPGTGKTTFIESLGSAFNREVIVIEGSKLTDKTIIGDGPDSIASKIRAAKGPVIIYINEANLIVSSFLQENSPITHLERLLEKGEIIDINGNKVYAQSHTFLLDMNLKDDHAEQFNKWKEENPEATTTETNAKLAELIKEELKARLAFMSRIINGENIHSFRHLDKDAMENIITLKVKEKKDQLLEEIGVSVNFEKDAIELLAEHAINNEGLRDYGARPILNRIDLIINVLKAELSASLEGPRIPENTEILIIGNNGQLFITIKAGERALVEGHYDLNEGGFSRSPTNTQQPTPSETQQPTPPESETPNVRFNFFNRNG